MPRPFEEVLSGGDRRSIGEVAHVVRAIRGAPARLPELVDALGGPDAVVVLRAADALEKLGRTRPDDSCHTAPVSSASPEPRTILRCAGTRCSRYRR